MPSTFIRHTVSARAVAVASRNTITRNHAQRFMAGRVSQAVDRVMHKYPSARSVAYFWSFLARAELESLSSAVTEDRLPPRQPAKGFKETRSTVEIAPRTEPVGLGGTFRVLGVI